MSQSAPVHPHQYDQRIPAQESCTPEMTALITDRHINFGSIKLVLTIPFLPLGHLETLKNNPSKGFKQFFQLEGHQPQRRDNETHTGLAVQKPFCSQWKRVLDAHSSSFVFCAAICRSCRVEGVCARQESIGTIGIAGAGGSWSGSSGAIWAWWQAKLSTAGTLGKCK